MKVLQIQVPQPQEFPTLAYLIQVNLPWEGMIQALFRETLLSYVFLTLTVQVFGISAYSKINKSGRKKPGKSPKLVNKLDTYAVGDTTEQLSQ